MFSTKQQIVILLTHPETLEGTSWVKPTLRDLKRGLKRYFGNDRTTRHIRRLLHELTDEGIIQREIMPPRAAIFGYQAQATRYIVVDFDRAFQGHHSLIERSKVVLARERRRVRTKELAAKGHKVVL